MGTRPSLPLFLLFTFFFFFHLALCCPLMLFSCGKPESTTDFSPQSCGRHLFRCSNLTLQLQFYGQGSWYPVYDIKYPEKTLIVRDTRLTEKLKSTDCDFLYSFTWPISNFSIQDLEPWILFNCKASSYNFSHDFFHGNYGYSYCGSYDLYYSEHPEKLNSQKKGNCSRTEAAVVEWLLQFEEVSQGVVDFSLKSVGFSRHGKLEPHCFGCLMRGGECGSVDAAVNSSCICHLPCPDKKKINTATKIGIGVGGVFFGLVLALGAFLCWRHRKKKGRTPSLSCLFRSISSHASSISKDPESLPGSYYKTPIFSYKELEEATGGFDSSNELGDGGFGVVFKGKLKDGRIVAVKRLYERNHRRVKQFRNEVEILNRLRHRNLVTLYGCTSAHESQDLLLVYEYIPNGTVADHLHGSLAAEHALTWHIRMSIAIETADALSYLHVHQPQIIHRDVKTSNILLDNNYTVKVADFGLSRLFPMDVTHVSTAPQGTPGYVDPEYHQCYQLTDKSDVYSFGVVLVELISSKAAVDISRHRSEINLSNMAIDKIPKGLIGELVDPMLGFHEDPVVRRMVEQVAEVAFRCLQPGRDERPSMDEVREMLKDIACMDVGSAPVGEKHMRDDACLLKSIHPYSPKSVADNWVSRSTTPNASA